MNRTVITAYYNDRNQRLKIPNDQKAVHASAATMRCHWNLLAGVYRNARSAEVYDSETGELFSQFRVTLRGGDLHVNSVYKADPRDHKDPIRRRSVHALFNDLEVVSEIKTTED
jgi:hypothetical protein